MLLPTIMEVPARGRNMQTPGCNLNRRGCRRALTDGYLLLIFIAERISRQSRLDRMTHVGPDTGTFSEAALAAFTTYIGCRNIPRYR